MRGLATLAYELERVNCTRARGARQERGLMPRSSATEVPLSSCAQQCSAVLASNSARNTASASASATVNQAESNALSAKATG